MINVVGVVHNDLCVLLKKTLICVFCSSLKLLKHISIDVSFMFCLNFKCLCLNYELYC